MMQHDFFQHGFIIKRLNFTQQQRAERIRFEHKRSHTPNRVLCSSWIQEIKSRMQINTAAYSFCIQYSLSPTPHCSYILIIKPLLVFSRLVNHSFEFELLRQHLLQTEVLYPVW